MSLDGLLFNSTVNKSHFYTVLFVLLPLFYYLSLPVTVGDMAWWTAYGNYFLNTGSFLVKDIYSVLETRPLVYPVLLPIFYSLLDQVGGLELVSLSHKAALVALLVLILRSSLSKLRNPWTAANFFWIAVSLNGISIYFIDRPALIALIPLLAAYLCIENEREFGMLFFGKLALILFVWVNIHGSWPLLFILLCWKFLFVTRRSTIDRHACILIGLGLVTIANPFGVRIWSYVYETGTISKLRHIDEWNVTNFHDYFPQGILFFLSAFAFLVFVIRKINLQVLSSPIFPLLLLGFLAFRNVGYFGLVALPFLYKYEFLSGGDPDAEDPRRSNLAITVAVAILCILFTPYFKPLIAQFLSEKKAMVFDEFYQAEVAAYIRSTGQVGPILNDWDYGSFLLYSLPNKILIDSRNVIYYQKDFEKYLEVMRGSEDWEDFTRVYGFDFILVPTRRRQQLIEKIKKSVDWKLIQQNSDTTLFQKTTASRP